MFIHSELGGGREREFVKGLCFLQKITQETSPST